MSDLLDLTPGLQCCVICRRILTDRALHDALEAPVLGSIRAEHPEWVGADESCEPCVSQYRHVLEERAVRSEQARQAENIWRHAAWLRSLFGRSRNAGAAEPQAAR